MIGIYAPYKEAELSDVPYIMKVEKFKLKEHKRKIKRGYVYRETADGGEIVFDPIVKELIDLMDEVNDATGIFV